MHRAPIVEEDAAGVATVGVEAEYETDERECGD